MDIPSTKPALSSIPLHPLIHERWSPRSLDTTAELTDEQVTALFEAARWAPSWGNTQPARYIAGRRGEETFERIAGTLSRGNSWAHSASLLALGVARSLDDEGNPYPYGEYGLGLATENLVLQAVAEGFVGHQMAGFDREEARAEFEIPENYEPLVAIAVGKLADPGQLVERQREKELAPRERNALNELVFVDRWGTPRSF